MAHNGTVMPMTMEIMVWSEEKEKRIMASQADNEDDSEILVSDPRNCLGSGHL